MAHARSVSKRAREVTPPDPPERTRRRAWFRRPLPLVGALLLVWLLTTAIALSVAWRELNAAEEDLADARLHLGEADLRAARAAVADAGDRLRAGDRWLSLPTVRLAVALPGVGTSVGVSRDLTTAVERVTVTVGEAFDALLAEDALEALTPRDGRLPVGAIADLAPDLARAADALEGAVTVAFEAPASGLARPVADARERLLKVLPEAAQQARNAADLTSRLPAFLGAEGPRRYLLGAANPAELRGTGGYVGAVTIATFEDGAFELSGFTPTYELTQPDPAKLPAPTPDDERYTPFGGTAAWQNLNLTPDAPTAAAAFERLWQAAYGERLDGTIIVDPFALEVLLGLTGPVEVPGIDERLDVDNVVRFVANEAYALFDEQDLRQEVLGQAAGVALQALLRDPPDDPIALAEDLGDLLAERHVILHAADPSTQAVFEAVGVAGELRDPLGDYFAVVLNSATASKVDFWARRNLTYDVRLLDDGAAAGQLEVNITNDAPTDGARRVVGPNSPDLEAGDNLLFVSTYCATTCTLEGGPNSDGDRESRLTSELGHPVWGSWHHIPSKSETTFRYGWVTDGAWWVDDGLLHYRLTYQHQTMVRGTNLTVRLALPDGTSVVELPRNATVADGVLTWEGFQRTDAVLDVTLRPAGR